MSRETAELSLETAELVDEAARRSPDLDGSESFDETLAELADVYITLAEMRDEWVAEAREREQEASAERERLRDFIKVDYSGSNYR